MKFKALNFDVFSRCILLEFTISCLEFSSLTRTLHNKALFKV